MGGSHAPWRNTQWYRRASKSLRMSITHWENLRDDVQGEISPGSHSCACCQTFVNCEGCPIAIYVEAVGCAETPYTPASIEYVERALHNNTCERETQVVFLKDVLRKVRSGQIKP